MFKTPVVLGTLLLSHLHLLTACSAYGSPTLDSLPITSQHTIAQELVEAITPRWFDAKKPISMRVKSGQDWLRDGLVAELTANQYSVAQKSIDSQELEVTATRLGSNALHVSLTSDGGHNVERVFRFQPIADSRAPSVIVGSDSHPSFVDSVPDENDVPVGPTTTPMAAKAVVTQPLDVAASHERERSVAADSPVTERCEVTEFQRGSLKQNLVESLTACGWRLVGWPADPDKPDHELDWLIPTTQELIFESVEELAQALRDAFDFEIEVNRTFKTVRILLRD